MIVVFFPFDKPRRRRSVLFTKRLQATCNNMAASLLVICSRWNSCLSFAIATSHGLPVRKLFWDQCSHSNSPHLRGYYRDESLLLAIKYYVFQALDMFRLIGIISLSHMHNFNTMLYLRFEIKGKRKQIHRNFANKSQSVYSYKQSGFNLRSLGTTIPPKTK